MEFSEWLKNAPDQSEIIPQIERTEHEIRALQTRLSFLHGVLSVSRAPKEEAPPQPVAKEEPFCFGKFEHFTPDDCKECPDFKACAKEVAKVVESQDDS